MAHAHENHDGGCAPVRVVDVNLLLHQQQQEDHAMPLLLPLFRQWNWV
jgi:hypothetical protein